MTILSKSIYRLHAIITNISIPLIMKMKKNKTYHLGSKCSQTVRAILNKISNAPVITSDLNLEYHRIKTIQDTKVTKHK